MHVHKVVIFLKNVPILRISNCLWEFLNLNWNYFFCSSSFLNDSIQIHTSSMYIVYYCTATIRSMHIVLVYNLMASGSSGVQRSNVCPQKALSNFLIVCYWIFFNLMSIISSYTELGMILKSENFHSSVDQELLVLGWWFPENSFRKIL